MTSYYVDFDDELLIIIIVVLLLAFMLGYVNRKMWVSPWFSVLHSLSLILLIAFVFLKITSKKSEKNDQLVRNKAGKILVEIRSVKSSFKHYKIEGIIIADPALAKETKNNRILITIPKAWLNEIPERSDKIWFRGKMYVITSSAIPYDFNPAEYYSKKSIFYQVYPNKPYEISLLKNERFSIFKYASNARILGENALHATMQDSLSIQLLKAMLFGDKKEIQKETSIIFSKTGVMHILAVSGLHVGIVYMLIRSMIFLCIPYKHRLLVLVSTSIPCIWFYAFVTGLSPSVMRAAFMFSLLAVGELVKRRSNTYNLLACSAFFILMFEPLKLFDLGFQLSYSAVLGIVSITPILNNLISPKKGIYKKLWTLIAISISAQISTLPVVLHSFNQFPTYFILSNLIAVPVTTLVIVLGILLLCTYPLKIVASLFGYSLDMVLSYLYSFLSEIASWPLSSIQIHLSSMQSILIALSLITLIHAIFNGSKRGIKYGLLLFIAVITIGIVHKYTGGGKSLIYYSSLKGEIFMGLSNNDEHILIPLSSNTFDVEYIRNKFEGFVLSEGIKEAKIESRNLLDKSGSISINGLGKRVMVFGNAWGYENLKSEKDEKIDVLVITDCSCKKLIDEHIISNVNTLLLSNRISRYCPEITNPFLGRNIEIRNMDYNDFYMLN